MKKIVCAIVLAAIIVTGTAFADPRPSGTGIGIVGGFRGNWDGESNITPALALKLPSLDPYLGIDLEIRERYFGFNLTADWNIIGGDLAPVLGWYIDLGGYLGISSHSNNDWSYFNLGARLPIGLTIKPIEILDIFLAIVPTLGLGLRVSGSGGDPLNFPQGGWGGNLGIRLWF